MDVGANIGVTSRAARIISPGCKIYCIEPSPKAFSYLDKNADDDWVLFNLAAGFDEGNMNFNESTFLAGSHIELNPKIIDSSKKIISIKSKKLDQIFHIDEIDSSPILVKIDVEGFELDVLKGASKLASSSNVLFVSEFNSYAIAANGKASPFCFLEEVVSIFGALYGIMDNKVIKVSSDKEIRDFFYQNMVVKMCVEDIFFGGRNAINFILENKF